MAYTCTPLSFLREDEKVYIKRGIDDEVSMLDNLVELIVFSAKGSFDGDPDFGFEYWNHEYSNVNYREFNNEQTGLSSTGHFREITKKECEDSIQKSLATYAPQLKRVSVEVTLNSAEAERQQKKKVPSKCVVTILVTGAVESEMRACQYRKEMKFLIEPTTKKYRT